MRFPSTVVTFLMATLFFSSVANGQRERRRQLVEGLLESLLESQLDKLNDDNQGRNNARPAQPARPANVPAEVRNARSELEHITNSMRNLVNVLQHESYTSPAYRQVLAEAINLQASTDALYRSSASFWQLQQFAQAWVPIDQNWRSLAHRLSQARGVNRSVTAIVDEVNAHTAEMEGLLGLKPQLDRLELVRLSTQLVTEFQYLLEDIDYDLRGNRSRRQYVDRGRQLLAQIQEATAWIDRGDYDSLVAAWQQGQQGWRPYAADLRRAGSDRINRGVRRIEQTGRQITEALWLPIPVDKQYLAHLVSQVKIDTDHILTTVSVKDLMEKTRPQEFLKAVRELQGSGGSFSQVVDSSESIEDLVWDFRVFEVAWQELANQCQSIENPEVLRHLQGGTETMSLLTQSLGSGPQISQQDIIRSVSQLGDLCNRMAVFINRKVMPVAQYDGQMKARIHTEMSGMLSSVRAMHNQMVNRQGNNISQQDLDAATAHWRRLRPLMSQIREADKPDYRQLRGELEPLLVKLQVVYSR